MLKDLVEGKKLRDIYFQEAKAIDYYQEPKKIRDLYKNLTGKPTRVRFLDMPNYIGISIKNKHDSDSQILAYKDGGLWVSFPKDQVDCDNVKKTLKGLTNYRVERDRSDKYMCDIVMRLKTGLTLKNLVKKVKLSKPKAINYKSIIASYNKIKSEDEAQAVLAMVRKVIEDRKVNLDILYKADEPLKLRTLRRSKEFSTYQVVEFVDVLIDKVFFDAGFGDMYIAKDLKDATNLMLVKVIETKVLKALMVASWTG